MVSQRLEKKNIINMRLSHFLLNGVEILSAKLGMNRSEVMRIALYNLLKRSFSKQELDWFANRQDVVDEWLYYLTEEAKGTGYRRDREFIRDKIDEQTPEPWEKEIEDESEKALRPIRKKYAFIQAQDFLRKTMMQPSEASQYFRDYYFKRDEEVRKYWKEIEEYGKKKYPKEVSKLESSLAKMKEKKPKNDAKKKLSKYEKKK